MRGMDTFGKEPGCRTESNTTRIRSNGSPACDFKMQIGFVSESPSFDSFRKNFRDSMLLLEAFPYAK